MVIRCQKIPFFGHIIGKPDIRKVAGIDKMEEPKNVAERQTFLVMVNYLSNYFTPKLATRTATLRDLLKEKDNEYCWGPEHSKAFTEVKEAIASTSNL